MTKIEWVARPGTMPETWNVVHGCTKTSEGCRNCYAERMARRLAGRYGYPDAPRHFDVTLRPDRLEEPLHWRKPRTVFVASMGDLFHKDVPMSFVSRAWMIMARTPQHTYQVLTKRPERMREYVQFLHAETAAAHPLSNVWLGVTTETQEHAAERIPYLLTTPAAVRFVSIEPMLGPVKLFGFSSPTWGVLPHGLDWVIVGGESGPGARPMHPDWARSVRDQCAEAGVPYFFKQWGRWAEDDEGLNWEPGNEGRFHLFDDGTQMYPVGKKRAGRRLDGEIYREWPA